MGGGEQDGDRERGTNHSGDEGRAITFHDGISQLHLNRTAGISISLLRI